MISFIILLPIASCISNFPVVRTSYGSVRGYEYKARNGFVGEIFKKIPFAAPPIGDRRWKKPFPPEPWNYTIDGTFAGPACAQIPVAKYAGYPTGFSEDCLTLNIYTSKACRQSNASCPVMHYIHGGSLIYSSAIHFPDEDLVWHFAAQGIVVVITSYRVGVFGVMALGDENALPANLALHDTVESLRFVQKEIHAFGGDKDQVTLIGNSIGANIALSLAFSTAVNKAGEPPLFARAISMSGSMNFFNEEKQLGRSYALATHLGCVGNASEIVECMLPLSTEVIIRAASKVGGPDQNSEKHLNGITKTGELFPVQDMKEFRANQKEHMDQIAPYPPTKLLLGTLIDEFRLQNNIVIDHLNDALDMIGVRHFDECLQKYHSDVQSGAFKPEFDTSSQGILAATALYGSTQARLGGEVYLYSLDYPKHSNHADDIEYLFGTRKFAKDENEHWLSRVYPMYFTNFIKGLPLAPAWQPLDPDLMNYYSINKSFTEGSVPRMRLGYQKRITDYYNDMLKFDEDLTYKRQKGLNAPVEYKELIILTNESLNFRDFFFYLGLFVITLYIVFKIRECVIHRRAEEYSRLPN